MSEEKVESYKLSKEQLDFTQRYKEVSKLHKVMALKLQGSLSEADQLREALVNIEVELGTLTDKVKNFDFNAIEGQVDEERMKESEIRGIR